MCANQNEYGIFNKKKMYRLYLTFYTEAVPCEDHCLPLFSIVSDQVWYIHRQWLETEIIQFWKEMDCNIYVAKQKVLIRYARLCMSLLAYSEMK